MSHGDFAPRNILANSHGRVVVLDTTAKWRSPIYEDIGYFLSHFETNRLQTLSYGLAFSPALIAECKKEFLHGYFEPDPVPFAVIKMFEIQEVANRWTTMMRNSQAATGARKFANRMQLAIKCRFYRRYIMQILTEIDAV